MLGTKLRMEESLYSIFRVTLSVLVHVLVYRISLSSEGKLERVCTAPKDLKAKAREMGPP